MPRKAKITAVPNDVQPGQTFEQQELKTEAEQMTDVINEVNVNEHVVSNDESAVQIAPKAQAKRVSEKQLVFPLVGNPSGKDTEL